MINSGGAAWGGGVGWQCPRKVDDSWIGMLRGWGRVRWGSWFALKGRPNSALLGGVRFGSRSFRPGAGLWGWGRLEVGRVSVGVGCWGRCVT